MCGACDYGRYPTVPCLDASPHQAEADTEPTTHDSTGRL